MNPYLGELKRFLADMELGKVNRGVRISVGRRAKYLDALKVALPFLGKPTASLTVKDIERFEKALASDKIQSRLKGRPYRDSTKNDIRKALKVFLRWRLGEATATELAGWLDVRERPKTPDYLKESEVKALLAACRSAEQRFLIAALFDAGARAEELHNVRMEDVELPEGGNAYPRLTLREEHSKTKGRVVALDSPTPVKPLRLSFTLGSSGLRIPKNSSRGKHF